MSLRTLLIDTKLNTPRQFKTDPGEAGWYRYFRDIRDTFITEENLRTFVPSEIYPYRFDIRGFLESQGYPLELHWHVCDLNNITDHKFTEDTGLRVYIPSLDQIQSAYGDFLARGA